MIIENVKITDRHKASSDATKRCGEYSQNNPSCPLRDNPFYPESMKAGRGLGVFHCPSCCLVTPEITNDLRTACCGSDVVNVDK